MKNVLIKNSILLVPILFFSCHRTLNNSKKEALKIDISKTINSASIVTNSLDPNFIYDLIETEKIKKGDTLLFREWASAKISPISIYNDKINFEVLGDTLSKFYKTGEEKFSKHKILITNGTDYNRFHIYSVAILNNNTEPYAMSQPSSLAKIKKLTKTTGRLDYSCEAFDEFNVDFKLKDNSMHIIRLSNLSYSYSETYKYELDTLIVLKKNDIIYPDSLHYAVTREKNRISVKDDRK